MRSSLALGLCVLVIGLLSSGALAQDRRTTPIEIPTVEYHGGIYYLVLDGETPYERGYQHGAALEFKIVAALRNFRQWLRDNASIEEPERMIQEFARTTGHIETVRRRLPDLYEEMQGIAEGAGVDFNELFVYQSFDELFLFLAQSGSLDVANGHCTTTGVYGRRGKPNYVTHNNDIPTYHEGAVTVLHIKYPDSDLEILQSTFAGQIAQNGVNNRGVGVGMNTIADLPTTSTGIPVSFNVRKILECNDRHEAIEYLKGIEAGTAMNYMIAGAGHLGGDMGRRMGDRRHIRRRFRRAHQSHVDRRRARGVRDGREHGRRLVRPHASAVGAGPWGVRERNLAHHAGGHEKAQEHQADPCQRRQAVRPDDHEPDRRDPEGGISGAVQHAGLAELVRPRRVRVLIPRALQQRALPIPTKRGSAPVPRTVRSRHSVP